MPWEDKNMNTLTTDELEQAYDLIAGAIDEVDSEKESLFLGKLCLILTHRLDSVSLLEEAIEKARQDL